MDDFTRQLAELLQEQPLQVLDKVIEYAYSFDNAIDPQVIDETTLFAEMPDSKRDIFYETDIELEKKKVSFFCTCKQNSVHNPCAHVLALAAEFISWHLNDVNVGEDVPPTLTVLYLAKRDYLLEALDGKVSVLNLLDDNWEGDYDDEEDEDPINYKELEGGWSSINCSPEYVFHDFMTEFDLRWPTPKDIQSLEKVSVDKTNRHWVYKYKAGVRKFEQMQLKYDGEETFLYHCTCGKKPACKHIAALLNTLILRNRSYFVLFKNYDREKAAYLLRYGLQINDPEAAEFEFTVTNKGLTVNIPSWAVALTDTKLIEQLASKILPAQKAAALSRPAPPKHEIIDFEIGFVLNLNSSKLTFLPYELEAVKVYAPKANGQLKINKLDIHTKANWGQLKNLSDELYALLISLSKVKMNQYSETQLGYTFQNSYSRINFIPEKVTLQMQKYYKEQLRKIWPLLVGHPHFYLFDGKRFSANALLPAAAFMPLVSIQPQVSIDERFITLELKPELGSALPDRPEKIDTMVPPFNKEALQSFQKKFTQPWQWAYSLFYISNRLQVGLASSDEEESWFSTLQGDKKRFPIIQKERVIKSLLPAIEARLGKPLELPKELQLKRIRITPSARVLVKEYMEKYLMLLPQFRYNGKWIDYNRHEQEVWLNPGEMLEDDDDTQSVAIQTVILRDHTTEAGFFERLRLLHPSFTKQLQNDFFYVPFDQVMQGQWFLKTLQLLAEENIPVYGIEALKKFRYSALKPKWEMKAGSQTDWFELKIEVSFGDEKLPLKTIRKALASGQHVIMLNDGSLGVLPEEWVKQYGTLLKMGQEKTPGTIRLSKLHYTLIEALYDEIDDAKVLAELSEKKKKLQDIEKVISVPVPKKIKGKLRPYQVSGFSWMNTLEQMGWGGCLADDMGLGKTLQTITFLQHLKVKYPGSTHLVVCPTSLLYNWENELRKFAPALSFWTHYGAIRSISQEEFAEHDIIITSYGMVRSDIELLKSFAWHYVILDESQAIKNPDALTTRALHLLNAKNKLILSGTPLQNNTYDLYSQFNFLNPGMLGSREFFREEFANAIDKYGDKHKAETLRKLLHPFMLRRTKAQVAPDLPEKTETILWCQMSKKQQQVYDEFKLQYRQALMKKIEEVGMAKAGMLIIEGLLRLRQICNSPMLLKNDDYAVEESVKVEELMREINENSGGHKLLVFSQFTEMLHLIEGQLRQQKIAYAYLDGSTTAHKRKEAVERFQNEAAVRVFLISLKAGGVGLNLTAADYVYLVDPWWNPAAEQQAIDRTHRIGQKQKIFAYKMICRNTVEEKILELQSRKRKLAGDLVGEDEAIAKNLTKEDIDYLFG